MDIATKNMIALLRDIADQLEAGNGQAWDAKIGAPDNPPYYPPHETRRTFQTVELRVILDVTKPEGA